jgi:hypothetical protein
MSEQKKLLHVLAAHPTLKQITEALLAHAEGLPVTARCLTCDTVLKVVDLTEVESLYVTCTDGCSNYREHRIRHPYGGAQLSSSLTDANTIGLNLSRQTIETKNINPILKNLSLLLEDAGTVHKFQERMLVSVDGYNDDPRQLWLIEEVRDCLRLLDERFPYWFHFCEKQTGALRMLALCLTPFIQTPEGEPWMSVVDYKEFIYSHAKALRELHESYNIPAKTTLDILESVSAYYDSKVGLQLPPSAEWGENSG